MRFLQRLLRRRSQKPQEQVEAPEPVMHEEVDENRERKEKDELQKRIHDQTHRLHVLEWQADVLSRRSKPNTADNS